MQLLSKQKEREGNAVRLEKKRIDTLLRKRKIALEEKKLSELDLGEEVKKRVVAFSAWNKGMQEKKALLLCEIESLEQKKAELIRSIKNLC